MALIDGARNGLASGAADKALTLVRQYQQRYPGGIFDPEAAALRIEALVRLGRSSEARGLAERFVATQPAGPLTERVKAVAGLARP
jgi:outer membrane protein assembly factor BamD (BamD/ComL family)